MASDQTPDSDLDWGFLLDENVGRDVADTLESSGYRVELVVDVLEEGAPDHDIVAHAVAEDLIIVTKDVSDFRALEYSEHEGVIAIHDHGYSSREIGAAIDAVVAAYGDRDSLRHVEILDDWTT